jgi:5-methylcytosine-specific restriction endonuclease McrA
MRSVSFPFYKSKAWKDCRAAYMHSVSGLCEECMKHGIIKAADIVHHKITLDDEKARDPEIALNFANLQAVCIDCHNRLHGSKALPKRYKIVDGELVITGDAPHASRAGGSAG